MQVFLFFRNVTIVTISRLNSFKMIRHIARVSQTTSRRSINKLFFPSDFQVEAQYYESCCNCENFLNIQAIKKRSASRPLAILGCYRHLQEAWKAVIPSSKMKFKLTLDFVQNVWVSLTACRTLLLKKQRLHEIWLAFFVFNVKKKWTRFPMAVHFTVIWLVSVI